MTGITLLIYAIAFAIGCMSLALVIVFHLQSSHVWTKYLIICHSSLLVSMVGSALILFGNIFLSGLPLIALNTMLSIIVIADTSFLLVFIPYFVTWIIASPWRAPYKQLFTLSAVVYLILGIVRLFTRNSIVETSQFFIFIFVLAFSFIVMLKNLSSISSKRVRMVAISVMLASIFLLPFVGIGLLKASVRVLIEGLYFLAWSIILLVFFFNYFGNQTVSKSERAELSLESLGQYHITQREFSVIKLISKGKTNKEIASDLQISVNTVNNHVANIFSKTEVRSRIDLLNLIRNAW
ncbi:MAG: helix-turn-helix transcriptional regulator [Spirochaetaceae bacterium]|nr:helix-turn-helix transcriptional regulator [Spirochaetaceae bacterium]